MNTTGPTEKHATPPTKILLNESYIRFGGGVRPQWSPAMKTGNTGMWRRMPALMLGPQWSPAMKTGNTGQGPALPAVLAWPQWSPAMKTGNTGVGAEGSRRDGEASMEPGHEDREYHWSHTRTDRGTPPQWSPAMKTGNTIPDLMPVIPRGAPQWSPAMKTGNTRHGHDHERDRRRASMEPGHEDREYSRRSRRRLKPTPPQWSPAMKTGNTRHAVGDPV